VAVASAVASVVAETATNGREKSRNTENRGVVNFIEVLTVPAFL
jgi:hypothetical protein